MKIELLRVCNLQNGCVKVEGIRILCRILIPEQQKGLEGEIEVMSNDKAEGILSQQQYLTEFVNFLCL